MMGPDGWNIMVYMANIRSILTISGSLWLVQGNYLFMVHIGKNTMDFLSYSVPGMIYIIDHGEEMRMTHPLMLGSKQQRKGHRKPEILGRSRLAGHSASPR